MDRGTSKHEAMAQVAGIVAAYLRGDADQVEIGRRLFRDNPAFVVGTFMLVDYLAEQLTRNGEMSAWSFSRRLRSRRRRWRLMQTKRGTKGKADQYGFTEEQSG